MREWSASELDRYNKKGTTRKQDQGSKNPIKREINVPKTASTPTQAAMGLKDRRANRKRDRFFRSSYRSTEAALPLLLPRVRAEPSACSEPEPERGDVREAYGGSG